MPETEPDDRPLWEPPRFRNPHDLTAFYDRVGRKEPVVMTVFHYVLHIPGMKDRCRHVPDRAVAEYAEDENGEFALVECPCGERRVVRGELEPCVGCERSYILGKRRAIVLYGNMPTPSVLRPAPEVAADATDS